MGVRQLLSTDLPPASCSTAAEQHVCRRRLHWWYPCLLCGTAAHGQACGCLAGCIPVTASRVLLRHCRHPLHLRAVFSVCCATMAAMSDRT